MKVLKYQEIRERIRHEIESERYLPDSRLPSENELCQKFKVSRMTIRKALENLRAEGYLYKKQGIGTFIRSANPDPVQIRAVQKNIALVLPRVLESNSKITFDVFSGIDSVIKTENCTLSLYQMIQTRREVGDFLQRVRGANPIGLIVTFASLLDDDIQPDLVKLGLPVVFLDGYPENLLFDVVTGEDYDSAYRAGRLFIGAGYRSIGYFSHSPYSYSVVRARYTGLYDALREENLDVSDRRFYCSKVQEETVEAGFVDRMREYLQLNPDLEAVLLFNDMDVTPFIIAAEQLGKKVPRDIKIISYGNHPVIRYYNGGITSFEQHFFQYGASAAKLLIQRAGGLLPSLQQERRIHYSLIRRASF